MLPNRHRPYDNLGMAIRNTPILLCVFTLASTGCADTARVPASQAQATPTNRLFAFQTVPSIAYGSIVVTRDRGYMAGGCYSSVTINGTFAARMDTGEAAVFQVPAGEILLRVGRDPMGEGLCAVNQGRMATRETSIREGDRKEFRIKTTAEGVLDIQRSE
jgi:hypothetical protein